MRTKQPCAATGEERVQKEWACPECDEQRMDYLVLGGGDEVTCTSCGTIYALALAPTGEVG